MRSNDAEQEIARLRLSLARSEASAAFMAARVAGKLGNQLADVSYESRRLAEAVRNFLNHLDTDGETLRAALNKWDEDETRRQQSNL